MAWRVKCTNNKAKKCAWMGDPSDLQEHLDVCPFEEIACPNEECSKTMERRYVIEHLETEGECEWSPIDCQYCGEQVSKSRQKEHEDICEEFPVQCCCEANMTRNQLSNHTNPEIGNCPEIYMDCIFKPVGCKFEGRKKDFEKHTKKNMDKHLVMLMKELVQVKQTLERVENGTKEVRKGKQNKNDLDSNKEFDDADKYYYNRNSEELDLELHHTFEKRRIHKGKKSKLPNDETKLGIMSETSSLDDSGLGDITLPLKDDPIPNPDLGHYMGMCNCVHDGTILWKVSNVNELMKSPLTESDRTPVYSKPFYTGKYGYKVRLELYLNGYGNGKDTHLSLYLIIMNGEYDDILPWPFQQKVVFMLYDQNKDCSLRRHHEMTIIDDEKLTMLEMTCPCLERPLTNENEGYGVDKLISHKNLNSRSFVRNDTIYVKAVISVI